MKPSMSGKGNSYLRQRPYEKLPWHAEDPMRQSRIQVQEEDKNETRIQDRNYGVRHGRRGHRTRCGMHKRPVAHRGVDVGDPRRRGGRGGQSAASLASFATSQGGTATSQGSIRERQEGGGPVDPVTGRCRRCSLAVTLSHEDAEKSEAVAAVARVRQLQHDNQ